MSEQAHATGVGTLPRSEYAFPGPLRDALVGAILDGRKTTTSALLEGYRRDGDPVPRVGLLEAVVDSADIPVCVTRIVEVWIARLAEVTLRHALDEGEGFTTVAQWRAGHARFWTSPEVVDELGDPPVPVDDDTQVVCVRFELVRRL